MNLKRGLFAGLAILAIGFVLNWIVPLILPSVSQEYQNTAIFRPWTDPLMMVYFAYPFILGLVSAYLWEKTRAKDALEFAKIYFVIATIPGMFITYTSFHLSLAMVLLWALTGFVQAYVAGRIFTKVK